ncbi:MAG: hypothetical protein ACOCTR_04510 [Candidatus Natronoplasma sp.]
MAREEKEVKEELAEKYEEGMQSERCEETCKELLEGERRSNSKSCKITQRS